MNTPMDKMNSAVIIALGLYFLKKVNGFKK